MLEARGAFREKEKLGRALAGLRFGKDMAAPIRPALVLPAFAVLAVAFAVLVVGRPRPVVGVRIRGGPTEGVRELSWRLELVERLGDLERPLAGRTVSVEARRGGGPASTWTGTLDAEGAASVSVALSGVSASGPVRVHVTTPEARDAVADAGVALTRAEWASSARRRGGWIEGASVAGMALRAAPARGVFAVPFRDPLWVEVRGDRAGSADIPIGASSEGATLDGTAVVSRAHPRARLFVTPVEHAVSIFLTARVAEGTEARLDLAPAVIPGALHAALEGDALVVESPIVRERAYVAVVSESARVLGATVPLVPDARGGARGVLTVKALPPGPLWAVVSSEPELRSASLVGWPLVVSDSGEPATTFDVPDVLLLDSVGAALSREAARVHRVRALAATFSALALALAGLLITRAARRARADLEAHLERAGADEDSTRRVADAGAWSVVVALLCLGLAAVMAAMYALWR